MTKPDWCRQDVWESAWRVTACHWSSDTGYRRAMAIQIARALLDARNAALEEAAEMARCAFDDRPRRDSMDWNDGYDAGTKAAATAIRYRIEVKK